MDCDLYERLAIEMREAGVEELGLSYPGKSFMLKWLPKAGLKLLNFSLVARCASDERYQWHGL